MDKIIRQYEANQNKKEIANNGNASSIDYVEEEPLAEKVNDDDDVEPIDDDDIPFDAFNRNPFKISLRSKAEEDIVNDAKRKKRMLASFEGAVRGRKDSAAEPIVTTAYNINRLAGLRTLHLSGCTRITDVCLRYTVRLPVLRDLSLAHCQQISSWGIERLVHNCPALEQVNLSECHNVNDKAVEQLAIHLRRLTRLRLERCSLLTDHTLDHLAVNCERLRHLDVRGCRAMCAEPSMRLVSLRSLRLCEQSKPGPYVDADSAATAFMRPPAPPPFVAAAMPRLRW